MKIHYNKWFFCFSLLFLFKPGIVSGIASLSLLDSLFDIIRFLLILGSVFLIFEQNGKLPLNRSLIILGLIFGGEIWKIVSTYMNGYSYSSWGSTLNTIGITLFTYISINWNKKAFLDGGRILLGSYVFINTLTVLLFPKGMYASSAYTQNFFLSYRNAWFVYYLLAVYICLLSNELYPSKERKRWLVFVILCEYLSMVLQWTATGIICISIGLVLFFIWKANRLPVFSVKAVIISEIVIAIGLIFFHIHEKAIYLIVFLLKKDITLTQRIRIWNNAISAIQGSMWIGRGSMDTMTAKTILGYGVNHAHSYYLNTILYFGLIGLIIGLFTIYYAFSAEKSRRLGYRNVKLINISMLVSLMTAFQVEAMMSIGYYLCLMYVIVAYTNSNCFCIDDGDER